MEGFTGFVDWLLSVKMDAITLPWLEANKYTIGFVLAFPYLVYRWVRRNVYQIKLADREFDAKEAEK